MLKHRYGLSMQAWVYRAKDLGIISESAAVTLFRRFRTMASQRGRKDEPGEPYQVEEPARLIRLVHRALAEDMISRSRAAELRRTERVAGVDARFELSRPVGVTLRQRWISEASVV